MLGPFIDELDEVGYFDDPTTVEEITNSLMSSDSKTVVKDSRLSLLEQIRARRNDSHIIDESNKEILPDIVIESDSTSNSNKSNLENYLPQQELDKQEVKSGFDSILDQIRTKRQSILGSPSTSQLGLHSNTESKLSPILSNKPSITNLLEDTTALFDDDIVDQQPENNNQLENYPTLDSLLTQVKSNQDKLENEDGKIDGPTSVIEPILKSAYEAGHTSKDDLLKHFKSRDNLLKEIISKRNNLVDSDNDSLELIVD
jgi:hypothetical protein